MCEVSFHEGRISFIEYIAKTVDVFRSPFHIVFDPFDLILSRKQKTEKTVFNMGFNISKLANFLVVELENCTRWER